MALEYAHSDLQSDFEIVLAAARQNPKSIKYSRGFTYNGREFKEIILASLQLSESSLNYLLDKRNEVISLAKVNGYVIQYISQSLKSDKEVVMTAVTANGRALHFASDDLKDDKEVVLAAVREDKFAIFAASERLKNDSDLFGFR